MSLDITRIILKDRNEGKKERFQGSFIDYINIVKKSPEVTMLSHQRLYEIIKRHGAVTVNTDENLRLRRIYGNDIIV